CPFRSAPGTVTTAASSSMRPCSAGVSGRACALRGGARIAKMTQPGSSSAMAYWSAASSAMTATAPARRAPPCSASTHSFRPVRQLLSKRRAGSRVHKRYDAPRTPYQRVLAAGILTPTQRDALHTQFAALDPIALARQIAHTLDVLWKLAEPRRAPQEAA